MRLHFQVVAFVIGVEFICIVREHFHQQNAETALPAVYQNNYFIFDVFDGFSFTTDESVWGGRELTNYNDVVTLSPAAQCTYPMKSISR
jgi:hypothetical protein